MPRLTQRLTFGEFLADNIVRFINLFTYLLTRFRYIGLVQDTQFCQSGTFQFPIMLIRFMLVTSWVAIIGVTHPPKNFAWGTNASIPPTIATFSTQTLDFFHFDYYISIS